MSSSEGSCVAHRGMITEALIIRKSGEYDCEVITKLKIDKMGMMSLAATDEQFDIFSFHRNSKDFMFR
jgi:hypothetical protein